MKYVLVLDQWFPSKLLLSSPQSFKHCFPPRFIHLFQVPLVYTFPKMAKVHDPTVPLILFILKLLAWSWRNQDTGLKKKPKYWNRVVWEIPNYETLAFVGKSRCVRIQISMCVQTSCLGTLCHDRVSCRGQRVKRGRPVRQWRKLCMSWWWGPEPGKRSHGATAALGWPLY